MLLRLQRQLANSAIILFFDRGEPIGPRLRLLGQQVQLADLERRLLVFFGHFLYAAAVQHRHMLLIVYRLVVSHVIYPLTLGAVLSQLVLQISDTRPVVDGLHGQLVFILANALAVPLLLSSNAIAQAYQVGPLCLQLIDLALQSPYFCLQLLRLRPRTLQALVAPNEQDVGHALLGYETMRSANRLLITGRHTAGASCWFVMGVLGPSG